jgi:chemotaxis protein methyltransferase CheR
MVTIAGIRGLQDEEFNLIKDIVHKESGIRLTELKKSLVQSRLMKRLRELQLRNYHDYCRFLTNNYDNEIINLINCITTNKTDFFRESKHFDFMKGVVLPEFEHSGRKRLRIWSAGCSTGAEPYSIAMTVLDYYMRKSMPDIKILATDIDTQVLMKGEEGVYGVSEIAGVDVDVLKRYFMRGSGAHNGSFKIKDFVKKIVYFGRLNLLEDTYPMKGRFNIIFCRNVIIYFDAESRERLFEKFHTHLHDDGYLILGHSETLAGLTNRFRFIGNTVYRKVL